MWRLQERYKDETFVHVLPKGGVPHTRHVRGSNHNLIAVFPDRLPGRAIVISGARSRMVSPLEQAWQNWSLSWYLLHIQEITRLACSCPGGRVNLSCVLKRPGASTDGHYGS